MKAPGGWPDAWSAVVLSAIALAAVGCDHLGPSPAFGPPEPAFEDVAWLAGAWTGVSERGVRTDEHWTPAAGGTMFGVNRTIVEGRTVFFEFLRLERTEEGGLVYLAAPGGRHPATPFRLVATGGEGLVFENPGHDYPQRVIYRREPPDGLVLRIEGVEQGVRKSSEWRLARFGP